MNITRRELFSLGVSIPVVLSSPTNLFAQQEGIALKHGRMSRDAAEGIINQAKTSIHQIYSTGDMALCLKTTKSLEQIKTECDYRDLHYQSNILLAMINFGFDKSSFSKTFDYIKENVTKYEDQETIFGISASYLAGILVETQTSKTLAFGMVGLSKIFELYTKSKFKEKPGMEKAWNSVIKRINPRFAGTTLTNALKTTFEYDGIQTYPEQYHNPKYDHQQEVYVGNITEKTYYGLTTDNPIIIRPNTNSKLFSKLFFSPESAMEIFKDGDDTKLIDIAPYLDSRKKGTKRDILRSLESLGIKYIDEDDIRRYQENYLGREWGKPRTTPVREISIKDGVTFEKFLRAGGCDPYHWIYGK